MLRVRSCEAARIRYLPNLTLIGLTMLKINATDGVISDSESQASFSL